MRPGSIPDDDDQPAPDDVALLSALAAGDRRALGLLYERHAPFLLAVAIRQFGNRSEAEDLVHDVFMEAWRKADDFDSARGTVRAWLYIRLRSRATDRLRAPRRARRRAFAEGAAPPPQLVAAAPTEPPLRSEQRALYDAIMGLSADLRDVVFAVYLDGLAVKAAATRLQIPEGTVKSRLSTARRRMRAALPQRGES